jgi:hypothetical protein
MLFVINYLLLSLSRIQSIHIKILLGITGLRVIYTRAHTHTRAHSRERDGENVRTCVGLNVTASTLMTAMMLFLYCS